MRLTTVVLSSVLAVGALASGLLPRGFATGPGLAQARAEKIHLKNGYQLEGWIVEETELEVRLAVIRDGAVGTLTFDQNAIETIDRERKEELEVVLAREQARLAEEERERRKAEELQRSKEAAARRAATDLAGTEPEPELEGEGDESAEAPVLELIVEEATPEEQAKIADFVRDLGSSRKSGSAAARRVRGRDGLIGMGAKAIPALNSALSDGSSWYRRMMGAEAVAGIASDDRRLGLYLQTIPELISRLGDSQPWVRVRANEALEAVSGVKMGAFDASSAKVSRRERKIIAKWKSWWKDTKPGSGAS